MHRRVPAIALFAVLVLGALFLQAADGPAASGIPYVGRLEMAGTPLTDPAVPMTFAIYDAASGGTLLHTEDVDVAVQDGAFAHVIGASGLNDAEGIYRSTALYLALTVDGTALVGRQRLYAATQAQRADRADTLDVTGGISAGGSIITGGDIAVSAPFAMTTTDDMGLVLGDHDDGVNDEPGDVSVRVGAGGTAKVTGPLEVTGTISSTEQVAGRWRRFNNGDISCPAGGSAVANWPGEIYANGGIALNPSDQEEIVVPEAGLYRVEASVLMRSLPTDERSDLTVQTRQSDVSPWSSQTTSRIHGFPDGDATHVIATTVSIGAGGGIRFLCQGTATHSIYGGGSAAFTTLAVTKIP